jgi:hypothetical protein
MNQRRLVNDQKSVMKPDGALCAKQFSMRYPRYLACAKLDGICFLKIKSPTRLARPTRPTPKPIAKRKAPTKINHSKNQERKQHETEH